MSTPQKCIAQRASDLLEAIRTLSEQQGYPPTVQELATDQGVSKTRVRQVLARLEAAGLLRRVPNTPRGLVLLEAAA